LEATRDQAEKNCGYHKNQKTSCAGKTYAKATTSKTNAEQVVVGRGVG
jgi:hypothetical protein